MLLSKIAEDLITALDEQTLASLGIPDHAQCLARLESEAEGSREKLVVWICEEFGKAPVKKILNRLGIAFNDRSPPKELVHLWFEQRKLQEARPKARPWELARTIEEHAKTIQTTPEKFDAVTSLIPACEVLMRYLGYFYAADLLSHQSADPKQESGTAAASVAEVLNGLNFAGLGKWISCEHPVKSQPYNPKCDKLVCISNSKARVALAQIENELNGQITDESKGSNWMIATSVIELLEQWVVHPEVIPRGAVMCRIEDSEAGRELICIDEFRDQLTVVVRTERSIGERESILVAKWEGKRLWAPDLQTLPNYPGWITPTESRPAASQARQKNAIFICYAHENEEWRKRVRLHLQNLERTLGLDVWDDRKIPAGEWWHSIIRNRVNIIGIAIVLVSKELLKSPYVKENELPALMEAKRRGEVTILPLWLEDCGDSWGICGLEDIQWVDSRPLAGLDDAEQEKILVKLAGDVVRSCRAGSES